MKTYTNKSFGALGEQYAAQYLKKQRYKILVKNYNNKLGEIDLIARDGDEIVFVEVKARSADPLLSGQYAVNRQKQFHILRTASLYLQESGTKLQPRFDVIEVEIDRASGKLVKLGHYKAAFMQTESYARF
jgi:putative endonuclease